MIPREHHICVGVCSFLFSSLGKEKEEANGGLGGSSCIPLRCRLPHFSLSVGWMSGKYIVLPPVTDAGLGWTGLGCDLVVLASQRHSKRVLYVGHSQNPRLGDIN